MTTQNSQPSQPGNMSEIKRLTTESDRLSSAVDSWNTWYIAFGLLALLVAFLVFFAQWRIIRKGKELASAQSDLIAAKDRKAVADSKDQDERIAAAQEKAAKSDEAAGKANERAGKAESSLAAAEMHSAEANAKAEGFRLEISKANESAAQAQSQVAEAKVEAAKANLELARIKSPRILSISEDTLAGLRAYPGTEYAFQGVQTDQESLDFLKQIDAALQSVGWKRVNPDPPATMGVNIFADDKNLISTIVLKGVKVEVGCAVDVSELQKELPALWPMSVKLAGGLRNAIVSSTTPASESNALPSVGIIKGASEVIRISVGSKP